MNNASYWDNRVKKYGHTGWADRIIYAFDQKARLKAVREIIKKLNIKKDLALDFGAGVGDFSELLSRDFKSVIAFDISEKAVNIARKYYGQIKNIKFIYGDFLKEIDIKDDSLDLVLTVTVLGHINDTNEVCKILDIFKRKLNKNGYLIVFENASTDKKNNDQYQRFTSFGEWQSLFEKTGFRLNKFYGFYHPEECPSESYRKYRDKLRIFNTNRYLDKISIEIIENENDFYYESDLNKTTKIMILSK